MDDILGFLRLQSAYLKNLNASAPVVGGASVSPQGYVPAAEGTPLARLKASKKIVQPATAIKYNAPTFLPGGIRG